jgi:serine/threonine-protein kinase
LVAVVERAMARDPAERFADGAELAQALAPLAAPAVAPDARTTRIAPARAVSPRVTVAAAAPRAAPGKRGGARPWMPIGLAAILLIALAAVGQIALGGRGVGSVTAEVVEVPAVAGTSIEQAEQVLRQAGLEPLRGEEQVTLDTPRGLVITQEPLEGERLRKGERVRLVVSQGIEIPNLVGRHWDDVKPWLDQHGWSLGRVRFIFANQRDFGKVMWQDPPSGSGPVQDKRSTPISLQVAGPPEATKTGFPVPGGAAGQSNSRQAGQPTPSVVPRSQEVKPGRSEQKPDERRQPPGQRRNDEDRDD